MKPNKQLMDGAAILIAAAAIITLFITAILYIEEQQQKMERLEAKVEYYSNEIVSLTLQNWDLKECYKNNTQE
jgi:hypothetical protein